MPNSLSPWERAGVRVYILAMQHPLLRNFFLDLTTRKSL
jgi:hypothetical protein